MVSLLESPGFRHKSLVNLALGLCVKEKCQTLSHRDALPLSHHQGSLVCLPRAFLVSEWHQPPQARNLGPNQRPSLTWQPHLPPAGCCPLALEIGAGTCRGLGALFPLPPPHDPYPPTPALALCAGDNCAILVVLPPACPLICHGSYFSSSYLFMASCLPHSFSLCISSAPSPLLHPSSHSFPLLFSPFASLLRVPG